MALEDNLLAGRDAAGFRLRVADCSFHWTCSPRVARTRDGEYGFRSPTACLELDRLTESPLIRLAIRPRAHQLPSQPESFRQRHRRNFLRHSDIAEGDSDVDRHNSRAGDGLALGRPSQGLLGGGGHAVWVSPGDQLGLGARGRTEGIPPCPGRRAVKLVRLLSRLALLSLAAAAFVELTGIYGGSARPDLPDPQSQAERRRSPSAPQVNQFLEFVGEGIVLAVYAVAGRTVLRLRLSPVSRGKGQPILLNLHRGRQDCQTEDGAGHSAIDPA
jgi:hypothetical protein